jgi:Flp pilus assembly protein TadG
MKTQARRNRERGNAIVEFAVSLPLLMAVVAGVFHFGYTFFIYNSLRSSVHAGARFASAADFTVGSTTFEDQVKNVTVYGTPTPDGDSVALVPGLTTDEVVVTANGADAVGIPRTVTVSISGYEIPSVWQSMELDGKPRATFPYMGQFISE